MQAAALLVQRHWRGYRARGGSRRAARRSLVAQLAAGLRAAGMPIGARQRSPAKGGRQARARRAAELEAKAASAAEAAMRWWLGPVGGRHAVVRGVPYMLSARPAPQADARRSRGTGRANRR